MNRSTSILRIILAGFLAFLATLATAQVVLYVFWLTGNSNPRYQLITVLISGFLGLFVGGLITARVMDSEDVWFSAFNGLLVGGTSGYFLLGLDPLLLAVVALSFIFAGLGGYAGLRRRDSNDTVLTDNEP